jgi:hypothetical protein
VEYFERIQSAEVIAPVSSGIQMEAVCRGRCVTVR